MIFIPPQWQLLAKLIGVLAIAGASAGAAWYLTAEHYQAQIASHTAADAEAVKAELQRQQKIAADRAETARKAEEQHAKDQLTINRLGNQLAGVRVHIPKCGSAMPGTGQAGADSNGSAGTLSSRVDEAFARLQSGVGQLIQRCDQLNIDAIAVNGREQ